MLLLPGSVLTLALVYHCSEKECIISWLASQSELSKGLRCRFSGFETGPEWGTGVCGQAGLGAAFVECQIPLASSRVRPPSQFPWSLKSQLNVHAACELQRAVPICDLSDVLKRILRAFLLIREVASLKIDGDIILGFQTLRAQEAIAK